MEGSALQAGSHECRSMGRGCMVPPAVAARGLPPINELVCWMPDAPRPRPRFVLCCGCLVVAASRQPSAVCVWTGHGKWAPSAHHAARPAVQ